MTRLQIPRLASLARNDERCLPVGVSTLTDAMNRHDFSCIINFEKGTVVSDAQTISVFSAGKFLETTLVSKFFDEGSVRNSSAGSFDGSLESQSIFKIFNALNNGLEVGHGKYDRLFAALAIDEEVLALESHGKIIP